jgi:hypothetical protein
MAGLRAPRNKAELQVMHSLRERAFYLEKNLPGFEGGDPEFLDPDNHFLGYWEGHDLLGIIRVDLEENGKAVLRKLAVAKS